MQYQSIIIQRNPAITSGIQWQNFVKSKIVLSILNSDDSPDKYILNPENNKYTISDIQKVIEWNAKKPFQSEAKVLIIEEADLLNNQSQNKLLKTLEEPAEYTQIILIVKNYTKLLDTIISRCQLFRILGKSDLSSEDLKLVENFLAGSNFADKLIIVEEICKQPNSQEIINIILDNLSERALVQGDPNLIDQILEFYELHRKNMHNNRLTLEALAIMLE